MLNITFEDADLVIINKPSGISTQREKSGELSLEEMYAQHQDCFVVNRIDKRVSGLVIFAKNAATAKYFGEIIQKREIKKTYRAVVAQKPERESDKLVHHLVKNSKNQKSQVVKEKTTLSQEAILTYKVLRSSERYHLLEIELETGRFHQIRAQLAAIGSPIVGDLKYGYKRSSPDGSIFLHCCALSFMHPSRKEIINTQTETPALWKKYGF
jgi:23S rRNA pseudouridine1911/1915/1917 synthase